MAEQSYEVEELLIEEEMKEAYLTFAMSVIISRALPDARDGLKPVQRRILVAMNELNLGPRSKTRKCGKIVGDVHGNYHPHGEQAIYDTLVRLAQPFTMRYPLVGSQGNFGSLDGDPPAAQRYTEARLSTVGMEMLQDLQRETVDFIDNYDGTRQEPSVLPGRFPCLLANGSAGIAVGMSTSIPPHNINELCDAILAVMDKPQISVRELMAIIPGPDFPTGGIICGQQGVYDGYATGRGTAVLRARTRVEEKKGGRQSIVVTEPPYRMDRDNLVRKIADAVQAGRVEDVHDIRNESDRAGTRLVIELKRDADPQVVLNQLFQRTPLQSTVSIILIAIVEGRPETLSIKRALQLYVRHRQEVIRRRTAHLLRRAEERAHIVEGLKVAIINIDEVLDIIRDSDEVAEARQRLMARFGLTEPQVDAIVGMQLRSLVGLERLKVEKEHEELLGKIADYRGVLADPQRVAAIIREDLADIKQRYGDERRTTISGEVEILERADLIPEENVVVTVSQRGYLKRTTPDAFRAQGRGGKGVIGADLQEEDFIRDMFTSSTHDYILFFTDLGLVYWLKIFMIPETQRTARGRALVNILQLREGERITGMVPVQEFEEDFYLLMATATGRVKKTRLDAFGKRGSGGIIALDLAEGDRLIGVRRTSGEDQILLGTRGGRAIRFAEQAVRSMGRTAAGVRGIRLREGDRVVDMALVQEGATLLTVCENGYGKRTEFPEYSLQGRGGVGVIDIKTAGRNGSVVAMREVFPDQQLILITGQGMTVRIPADSVSCIGRNTMGVKLITTGKGDRVSAVAPVVPEQEEEQEGPAQEEPTEAEEQAS
ncbi:MAG: DNA gyrase subunit A [Planctomycetota bacterium]|jgi:DNA gyrase subunit A